MKLTKEDLNKPPAFIEQRPWGEFLCFGQNIKCTAKVLTLEPRQALSAQLHNHRDQLYFIPTNYGKIFVEYSREPVPNELVHEGSVIFNWWTNGHHISSREPGMYLFKRRVIHRVTNLTDKPQHIFEVAYGNNDEDDIIRIMDKYGRVKEEPTWDFIGRK